jgi:hypothetical protein
MYGLKQGDDFIFFPSYLQTTSSDPSAENPYATYPNTTICGSYVFVFYSDVYADTYEDGSNPMIAVGNIDTETWADAKVIEGAEGSIPAAISLEGDVVFDGEKYIALVTIEQSGVKENLMRGTATDPMGDWTWTQIEEVGFGSDDVLIDYSSMVAEFAKDGDGNPTGFAFLCANGQTTDGNYLPLFGYAYSNDWGQTWNLETPGQLLTIPDDGVVDGDKNLADNGFSEQFPFVIGEGETEYHLAPDSSEYINKAKTWGRPDVVVTENNNINILIKTSPTTTGSGGLSSWYSDDRGDIYMGYYNLRGHFTGSGIEWKGAKLIGNFPHTAKMSSIYDGDPSKYINQYNANMTYLGDDRLLCTYAGVQFMGGDSIPATDAWPDLSDVGYDFVEDFYATVSHNAGTDDEKWAHESVDTIKFTGGRECLNYNPYNLTNTAEHDMGFTPAKMAKKVSEADGSVTYQTYGIAMYADLTAPIADTPTRLYEYEGDYHLWDIKVNYDLNNIGEDPFTARKVYKLKQNYPNPFNPTTTINFKLDAASDVRLTVFNALGEEVASLVNGRIGKGMHKVKFDGRGLNSGVYFYRLNVNGAVDTKKMVLTK